MLTWKPADAYAYSCQRFWDQIKLVSKSQFWLFIDLFFV